MQSPIVAKGVFLFLVALAAPSLPAQTTAPAPPAPGAGKRIGQEPCWQEAGVPRSAVAQRRGIERATKTQVAAVFSGTTGSDSVVRGITRWHATRRRQDAPGQRGRSLWRDARSGAESANCAAATSRICAPALAPGGSRISRIPDHTADEMLSGGEKPGAEQRPAGLSVSPPNFCRPPSRGQMTESTL
jgi:hypothetical protein